MITHLFNVKHLKFYLDCILKKKFMKIGTDYPRIYIHIYDPR